MTLREALVHCIDFVRASGTEDPTAIHAAKILGRRAEKLRAQQEEPAAWQHYCDCGERKRKELNFCRECYRAFPTRLVTDWLVGTANQSARAFAQMKLISETRVQTAALEDAA